MKPPPAGHLCCTRSYLDPKDSGPSKSVPLPEQERHAKVGTARVRKRVSTKVLNVLPSVEASCDIPRFVATTGLIPLAV